MAKKKSRDVERTYTAKQFVSKLRRLADALENDKSFQIQIAGERARGPSAATLPVEHERDGSADLAARSALSRARRPPNLHRRGGPDGRPTSRAREAPMDRRTALRALAAAAAFPFASSAEGESPREARRVLDCAPSGVGPFRGAAQTERQLAMVSVIADVILPPTDTPGATDAGVPGFVDLIVAEWFDPDEAERFTEGLAELDSGSSERFGRGFLEASPEQRSLLVTELDRALVESRERDAGGVDAPDTFFQWMKRLTLTGYFTSEPGLAAVGYRVVPGRFEGCVGPGAGR